MGFVTLRIPEFERYKGLFIYRLKLVVPLHPSGILVLAAVRELKALARLLCPVPVWRSQVFERHFSRTELTFNIVQGTGGKS